MNNVVLAGNLTADPELKTIGDGVSLASFTIACQRRYKNAEGKYDADFVPCIAWRKTAEFIAKYFHKGDRIGVQGSISVRTYEDETGKKHWRQDVVVDNAEFCGAKRDGGSGGRSADAYPAPPPQRSGPAAVTDDQIDYGDDLVKDFQPLDDTELPF